MAIATYSDYYTALSKPEIINFGKAFISRFSGGHQWTAGGLPAAATAPTTAVACDNTTTGAYNVGSPVGADAGTEWILARHSVNANNLLSLFVVCDRLSHQGGLSATTTGVQTTNLPTAALTRYTSGEGVFICLDIYTAIGTTATTITAVYTNQAGTGSRTTKDVVFGGGGYNGLLSRIFLPLQDGDTGARSVESVTLAATTGTAGNFGVTLVKPLAVLMPAIGGTEAFGTNIGNNLIGGGVQFEPFLEGCCIEISSFTGASSQTYGTLGFIRK